MVRHLTRLAAVAAAGLIVAAGLGLALPVGLAAAEPSVTFLIPCQSRGLT